MQETVKEPGWLSFDSVDFWTKYEDSLEKMTDDDLNVYTTQMHSKYSTNIDSAFFISPFQ